MSKYEPFLLALLVAYAGARIYQKYFKKDGAKVSGEKKKKQSDRLSDDSDYEPYSGK